jgi:aspartate/methionine/tyrosine aminotransferase
VTEVAALRLAASLNRLGTESAFSVLARARELEREGRDVIHLEIGEPDFDTPAHVCEAAYAAMRAGHTHYCPAAGMPELREATAAYLSSSRGIDVRSEQVLIANGAKPFLFFTILAVCDPGDEVVYPDPGFPIYESAISWAGAVPVPLPLHEEKDFVFDVGELEARLSPRTKLVILNAPHNPTGGLIDASTLDETALLLQESDAWVLSDEVYWRLVYDGEFTSIASRQGMLERTILLDGLSKAYAMTGWRCGFAAVPEPLSDPLVRFFVNSTSCVPPFVQLAGVAALNGPQDPVEAMLDEFRSRRRLVIDRLNDIPGISCRRPAGAFYAFPNVGSLPICADELASRLLEEAGVALLAGSAFGQIGRDHLRISYANSQTNLERALDRITGLIDGLAQS